MVSQSKLEITRKLFYWLTISNFLYIIVLLILAGVTINILLGQDGIINRTQTAATEHEKAAVLETLKLAVAEGEMECHTNPETSKKVAYQTALENSGATITSATDEKIEGTIVRNNKTYTFEVNVTTGEVKLIDGNGGTPTTPPETAEYTITYDLDGGTLATGSENPSKYTIETENITLNNPSKEGYTFTGWSGTGLTGNTNSEVSITKGSTGERSYTANWTPIEYTITYDLDGGTLATGSENPSKYTIETENITLNNPSKEGHTFTGWSGTGISGTSTSVTIAKGSTGARSYTANWQENIKAYTAGQEVTVGGEKFFVLYNSGTSESTVTLIAKYNLNTAGTAQQNAAYGTTACAFSTSAYWSGTPADLNSVSSTVATAVNRAKSYGTAKGGTGRLLLKSEYDSLKSSLGNILRGISYSSGATTNDYLRYWLGSANSSSDVWRVDGYDENAGHSTCTSSTTRGVRPVLTVEKTLVE